LSDRAPQSSRDGFRDARESEGIFLHACQGDQIPLILGHRDVRSAAKDWQTFSSDAPFRVPIPSEEAVRTVRQIPIELDPPQHTAYRKAIEPWFLRPTKPDYCARLDQLVFEMLDQAIDSGEVEIMADFALPLQSRALAILLELPDSEAEHWIGWGNSLFREGDGVAKGAQLDAYLAAQFARAQRDSGAPDFFAFLTRLEVEGRHLTEDELFGIANLVFAGGRDTVINAVAEILAHCATHAETLTELRDNPRLINGAVEEFVRFTSPLSFIGRVCPRGAEMGTVSVASDERVGLCWASANHDASVFEDPATFQLDRKPNPHMGFGSGKHACLGAAHARALMRCLLSQLASMQRTLDLIDEQPAFEDFGDIQRRLGFETLVMRFDRAEAG